MTPINRLAQAAMLALIVVIAGKGIYIHAKAELSQHLLQFAWARSVTLQQASKPWPWADTYPKAHLSIPAKNINLIVLDGHSGESMAFAPGMQTLSSNESADVDSILIGGHRDTHLRFLKDVSIGEEFVLTDITGETRHYFLETSFIVDTDIETFQLDVSRDLLVLVTCYPFDALAAGGSQRFVAIALPSIAPPMHTATRENSIQQN